jgi:hypothetical protein
MRGRLVVGPRCIEAAVVDVIAGLCGARQRTVPRRVVPGLRGAVAGLSGVVCWAMFCPVHDASWPGSME